MNETYLDIELLLASINGFVANKGRWMNGETVCALLGLPASTIKSLPTEHISTDSAYTPYVTDNGLYQLISMADSQHPLVEHFQGWLNDEVKPSLARTGRFVLGQLSIVDHPEIDDDLLKEGQQYAEAHLDFLVWKQIVSDTYGRIDDEEALHEAA